MFGLFKFFGIKYPYNAPDDTVIGAPEAKTDTLDILSADDDEEEVLDISKAPKKEEIKDKEDEPVRDEPKDDEDTDHDKEDEETDELKELEEELKEEDEEIDEEKLELITPVRRREILKKYPKLFQDFPYLERAYYREQQFTEVFPTIDDAKIAATKVAQLDDFEKHLLSGNTEKILQAVKDHDPNAFNGIVDNYLQNLAKVSPDGYQHVINNIFRHAVIVMSRDKNDHVKNAANILNQYMFGTEDVVPPTKLATEKKPEDNKEAEELRARENERMRRAFETTRDDLTQRIDSSIIKTIDAHIDPNNQMTEFVKRAAVRQAQEQVKDLIGKDARFRIVLDKLWEKGFKDEFSKDSVERLRSAILSKAKTLLPAVIQSARKEALKGNRRNPEERDRKGPLAVNRPTTRSSTSSSKSGQSNNGQGMRKGESTLDFFNRED